MATTFALGFVARLAAWLATLFPGALVPDTAVAAEPAATAPVIHACDKPLMFGFGAWEEAKKAFPAGPEGIRFVAKNCQGGAGVAGMNVPVAADWADWSPTLTLTVGQGNQAAAVTLHLHDSDETRHVYRFDLRGCKPGRPETIAPEYGASLAEPFQSEKEGDKPGLQNVNLFMIIGDWSDKPIDVVLSRIALTPPTEALRAGRAKLRELRAQEAEQARREAEAREQARRELLARGAEHPEDGPEVQGVHAVAPDVLAVVVQAGRHVSNRLVPYVAEPSDEIVEEAKDKPIHEIRDGKLVTSYQRAVFRTIDGRRERLGLLAHDGKYLFIEGKTAGRPLDETVADWPEAYAIQSADDPAYAQPVRPLAVFRKGKPNGHSQPLPFLYTISLKLPSPPREGATYTIRFIALNTSRETARYTHEPRRAESLAIHAIQTGYRPDDPFKRAYVSFWMGVDRDGNHGSCTPAVDRFELLDGAGKTVFSGRAELAKPAGAEEQISIHERLDYAKAAVYRLDFSEFRAPGEYRVHVPGLGVSKPLRIAEDVWEGPLRAAMLAVFTQRQAIELGPPACNYTRRRPFHPDDGVEFYQMTIPVQAGQEDTRGENLARLAASGRLRRVGGVWGGYQDAGDWDTLGHHLSATYDLLGLHDLNAEAFARIRLSLPAEEANNNLPDLLDEALWQLDCWRRLQLPDGSVRGGYGYGWGCPPGTTSWMIRSAGVYAPDPVTTLHYAAAAARAARVLKAYDPKTAAEYLASARRAWDWAEVHGREDGAEFRAVLVYDKDLAKHVRDARAMAAVELLAATGEAAFDAAFAQATELSAGTGLYLEQPGADFAYARLPEPLGQPELKRRAVERITAYADHAIAFSRNNAFDIIAGHRTDMPMIFVSRFFSTPGAAGMALIHAHALTGKPEYLAAAVQGSNYCLGANPDNLSYCTGVGQRWQRFNFIVDAQVTGQLPDRIVGHIPYGQGNEGNAMSRSANGWVQQWLLNFGPAKKMTPNWYDWPVYEQYVDFGRYPLHNENCFNQTNVPAACYWFYLHARPRQAR